MVEYDSYGTAKRVRVPDIGFPAPKGGYSAEQIREYEKKVLESYIKSHPTAGNKISSYYYPNTNYKETVKLMEQAERSKFPQSYGFFGIGHNCGTYSSDVSQGIDPNQTRYHLPLTPNAMGAWEYLKSLISLPAPASDNMILNPIYK